MHTGRQRSGTWAVLLIMALAVCLRLYGVWWGLPELFEEAMPYKQAWEMWGWGERADLDLNPHFFHYPSLVLYLQFLGQGLLYLVTRLFGAADSALDFQVQYVLDKTPFVLVGRLITVLLGAGTVLVTYLAGRRIGGDRVGLPAAFLMAVNAFHIQQSQVIEVDVPTTFFITLALYAMLCMLDSPTRRYYLLAGVATGLAASAKYTAIFLVLPLALSHLYARRGRMRTGNRAGGGKRSAKRARSDGQTERKGRRAGKSDRPLLRYFMLALAASAVVFAVTSPYVLIDFDTFVKHMAIERQHMRLGHFGLETSRTWQYYAASIVGRLAGWPLALLALAGVLYLAAVRKREWAVVCVSLVVPYLIAVSSWAMKADRYLLPVLPAMTLLGAGMLAVFLSSGVLANVKRTGRTIVAVAAVLLVSLPLLAAYRGVIERCRLDTRIAARDWIEAHVPPGVFIVTESYGPALVGPPHLWQLEREVRMKVLQKTVARPSFAVLPIPMFQMKPERSEVFYDLSLYEVADLIVTSSWVRSRYMREPFRFSRQNEFYERLESDFEFLHEIRPDGMNGPTITIYRNPLHRRQFAVREQVEGPRRLRHTRAVGSGSEELFYTNLGMNYESFNYYPQALESYLRGFEYRIVRPSSYRMLVLGTTRCLIALKRRDDAAAFLGEAAARAPTPETRRAVLDMQRRILSRMQTVD